MGEQECEHNWVTDYMGDPDVPGGQMFFGYCTKCGVSSDNPSDDIDEGFDRYESGDLGPS